MYAKAVLTVPSIECYVDSVGSLYDRDVAKGHGRAGRQFDPLKAMYVVESPSELKISRGKFGGLLESPRLLIPMLLFRPASGMRDPYSSVLRAGDLPAGVSRHSIRSKPAYTKFKPVSLGRSTVSWPPEVRSSDNLGCLLPRNRRPVGVYSATLENRRRRSGFWPLRRPPHLTR